MAQKTFISFRGEDELRVWALRGLATSRTLSLKWNDVSLRDEINSKDDSYIKSVIRPKSNPVKFVFV